jgi:hypothetical protein
VLARPLFPIRTAESRYESGANVHQSCLSLKGKLRPTQLAASVDEHHSHWAEMVPSASGAVLHASGKVQVNGASSRDTALFSGDFDPDGRRLGGKHCCRWTVSAG